MKNTLKLGLAALVMLFATQTIFAKDRISAGLEFGAIGYEGKFNHTTTISGSSVTMPYTRTTFNPDFRVRLDLPVIDIRENCFLSANLDYDFSWYNQSSSDSSAFSNKTILTHYITFQPEIVFSKGNLRFIAGTGLTFGISSAEIEQKTTSTTETEEYKNYTFMWDFELGLRYYLSKHISLLADFTISIPFINLKRNDTYSKTQSGKTTNKIYADTNTHGLSVPYFSPKVGISYTF